MNDNGRMTRVKDWLLGAVAMLLLIVVALGVTWWWITDPSDDAAPAPSASATPMDWPSLAPKDLGPSEIWVGNAEVSIDDVVLPDTPLQDVTARAFGARSNADGLVVAGLDASGTVSFSRVERELGPRAKLHNADGGRVSVERTEEVGGRLLRVVATGEVSVRDGKVHVNPTAIDIGGPRFLAEQLGDLAREWVTIEFPIDGLPPNLELTEVDVVPGGFRARLQGLDVVLSEGSS